MLHMTIQKCITFLANYKHARQIAALNGCITHHCSKTIFLVLPIKQPMVIIVSILKRVIMSTGQLVGRRLSVTTWPMVIKLTPSLYEKLGMNINNSRKKLSELLKLKLAITNIFSLYICKENYFTPEAKIFPIWHTVKLFIFAGTKFHSNDKKKVPTVINSCIANFIKFFEICKKAEDCCISWDHPPLRVYVSS